MTSTKGIRLTGKRKKNCAEGSNLIKHTDGIDQAEWEFDKMISLRFGSIHQQERQKNTIILQLECKHFSFVVHWLMHGCPLQFQNAKENRVTEMAGQYGTDILIIQNHDIQHKLQYHKHGVSGGQYGTIHGIHVIHVLLLLVKCSYLLTLSY